MKFALFVVALVAVAAGSLQAIQGGRVRFPGATGPLRQQLATFQRVEEGGNDLEALCKDKAMDLTSLAQLRELVRQASKTGYSQALKCPEGLLGRLEALVALVGQNQASLCAPEAVERFVAYYKTNLDTSAGQNKAQLEKSLKRFALAYGLQMSNLCRKNWVEIVNDERFGTLGVSDEQSKQVGEYVDGAGPVRKLLELLGEPDQLLVPSDLPEKLVKSNIVAKELNFLQSASSERMGQLQAVCQEYFKPVYGPLMMPVARLANLGFSYRDRELRAQLADPDQLREPAHWARIMYLCESVAASGANTPTATFDGKPVYNLLDTPVTMGEQIVDKQDEALMAAIKGFKTNRDEQRVILWRLRKNADGVIKAFLAGARLRQTLNAGFRTIGRKVHLGGVKDKKEALVSEVEDEDEEEEEQEHEGDHASSR